MTLAGPVMSLRGITKTFGGVHALRGVDLDFAPGTVTALLGENGAGKSTLMRISAGVEIADGGVILLDGQRVNIRSVSEANAAGISIVFQELSLFPHLSVAANVLSRHEPRRLGFIDVQAMENQAQELLDRVGCTAAVTAPVASLSLPDQQLVEIAKALSTSARILILDEPNSALRPNETERVLGVVRDLRDQGVAIILVSHRLEEVFAVADEVAVLRDGVVVRKTPATESSIAQVVIDMLGNVPGAQRTPNTRSIAPSNPGRRSLVLRGVSVQHRLIDATLEAFQGEIVGVAGLEGAGHAAVIDVLFGRSRGRGFIRLPSGRPAPTSERVAVRDGVAYVPADRKTEGLSVNQSCEVNLAHVSVGSRGRPFSLVKKKELHSRADQLKQALNIRMAAPTYPASSLSGGNQQKLVFGKWWSLPNDVVLLDDPTRGVDAGGKEGIHRLVREMADAGAVVIVSSSDLLELADVCDRVVVFYQRRSVGIMQGDGLTPNALLHAINTGYIPSHATPDQGAPVN